jgi:hypothetical protein
MLLCMHVCAPFCTCVCLRVQCASTCACVCKSNSNTVGFCRILSRCGRSHVACVYSSPRYCSLPNGRRPAIGVQVETVQSPDRDRGVWATVGAVIAVTTAVEDLGHFGRQATAAASRQVPGVCRLCLWRAQLSLRCAAPQQQS